DGLRDGNCVSASIRYTIRAGYDRRAGARGYITYMRYYDCTNTVIGLVGDGIDIWWRYQFDTFYRYICWRGRSWWCGVIDGDGLRDGDCVSASIRYTIRCSYDSPAGARGY